MGRIKMKIEKYLREKKERKRFESADQRVVREAYYKTLDGIVELGEEAKLEKDRNLIKLVSDMDKTISQLKRHLDANYLWD